MNQPEITDEEIKGMMDFRQVLDGHRKAAATRSAKKWSIAISGAIIASVCVYYATRNTSTPEPNVLQPSKLSEQPKPVATPDSALKKTETPTPVAKPLSLPKNEPGLPTAQPSAEATKVDIYLQAEPVEGYPHLYKYFNDQLTYPQEAAKDSIQGVVSVTFIVRPSGEVDHITITNSLGPLFDAEALRVMQGMPPWKPAQLNGKAVPSKMSVPLTFRIETTKK
jgi:TonB family protein